MKKENSRKVLCFYHSSDLDGHCSGAIVRHLHPDAEMIGINYGEKFPWHKIDAGSLVYMVDFCLAPFDEMERLDRIAELVWIDHHSTALKEAHKRGFIAGGGQAIEIGKAGCELAWDYCFPADKMPVGVQMLGRYDVWDFANYAGSLAFQFGMRVHADTRPDMNDGLWASIIYDNHDFIEKTVRDGGVIINYREGQNRKIAEALSFETEIDGHAAIAINAGMTNSQILDSVFDKGKHELMITFCYVDGVWRVSLYTYDGSGVDVGRLAKMYGGGGHKCAAGFVCSDIVDFL